MPTVFALLWAVQYYCDRGPCGERPSNLAIFNVTYDGIKGTAPKGVPGQASIQCSGSVNCQGLKFSNVGITQDGGNTLPASIKNAWGRVSTAVQPSLKSLQLGASSSSQWNALRSQAAACGYATHNSPFLRLHRPLVPHHIV